MNVAVVGGGMLGMTVAWRAALAGNRVTIWESSARCGGLAQPWTVGDVTWDRHYHVIVRADRQLLSLLRELNLSDDVQWVSAKTGFYVDGAMHPFTTIADFLRFPPLTMWQKARLGTAILEAQRIKDWRALERITAVDWLTRKCGRATVERVWLPLLRAKLGPFAERASAAFIWAVIARMYGARDTGAKQESFGFVRGGYDTILGRFEERLRSVNVQIRTNRRVRHVSRVAGRLAVVTEDEVGTYDRVLVTLAAPLVPRVVPDLAPLERVLCENIQYQGIVCASLVSKQPVSPYYITNIADPSVPFTGVIEMSALTGREQFGGKNLIYLPRYCAPDDALLDSSDAYVEQRFINALERMHPAFERSQVEAFRVSRVPFVFPVPTLEYSSRVPAIETSIPGLFAANSAHIVNGTLNVNETVTLAENVWRRMVRAKAPERIEEHV